MWDKQSTTSTVKLLTGMLYLIPLIFLALFFFYPLFSIFTLSFSSQGKVELSALVGSSYFIRTIWFTLWQATLSTILVVMLAMPGAYIFARYNFRGKSLLRALTTIPFVLPTIVVANAFTAWLGQRGQLNLIIMWLFGLDYPPIDLQQTIWIILLAHLFYNYTVVIRIVGGFWGNLNPRLEEAARMLGARPIDILWRITLPLLAPAIAAAALLVFIFSFTSFGVILILGGPHFATLEVEIYRQTIHLFNLPVAATLSIIQIFFTFLLMWLYTRLQTHITTPLDMKPHHQSQRQIKTTRDRLIVGGNVLFMIILLFMPLIALIERSLRLNGQLSFYYYSELFINRRDSILYVPPIQAMANSLLFATITVVMALILGLISATLLSRLERKKNTGWVGYFDPLLMLPLGTSAVTLGFGFIIALDKPPLNLRASFWLIPLAHTLIAFPFVVRSLLPALRGISPSLHESAATLGANPLRVWLEIDLPIIGRSLLVGAIFAFTISLGEFGASSLIARPETHTMPVAIYRFLGQPGASNYGQALAMSTLLMLVSAVSIIGIERFRVGDIGEF